MNSTNSKNTHPHQGGFFLLEMLIVIVLFAILGMTIAQSAVLSEQNRTLSLHQSVAMQIAVDTLESYASVDPITLDDTDNETHSITRNNVSYESESTITVNPDLSRTIVVNVHSTTGQIRANASVTGTFAVWGSQ